MSWTGISGSLKAHDSDHKHCGTLTQYPPVPVLFPELTMNNEQEHYPVGELFICGSLELGTFVVK